MSQNASVALFFSRADDLISSKYILADKKLAGLLKAIAASETVYSLFKEVLIGYDYEKAKRSCMVLTGSDHIKELIMPSSVNDMLSFTLCLLYDINDKKIDLYKFLKDYFYTDGGSVYAAYDGFIETVIKPFIAAVRLSLPEEKQEVTPTDELFAYIKEERAYIARYGDRFGKMLDAFASALAIEDREYMREAFSTYFYVVTHEAKNYDGLAYKMQKTLAACSII